jgi:hypothetical protein
MIFSQILLTMVFFGRWAQSSLAHGPKRPWLVAIFYINFLKFLINISLKVGTKFVSLWSKKVVIGKKKLHKVFFIFRNYFEDIRWV